MTLGESNNTVSKFYTKSVFIATITFAVAALSARVYAQSEDNLVAHDIAPPTLKSPLPLSERVKELLKNATALKNSGKFDEAVSSLNLSSPTTVESLQIQIGKAILLDRYGNALVEKGDWQHAYPKFGEAYLIDSLFIDRQTQATKDLIAMGIALSKTSHLSDSAKCFSRAIPTARFVKDSSLESRAWNYLGIVESDLNCPQLAVVALQVALRIRLANRNGKGDYSDPDLLADTYTNLGSALGDIGDYQQGFEALDRAISLSRKFKLDAELMDAEGDEAALFIRRQKYAQAEPLLIDRLRIAEMLDSDVEKARSDLQYNRAMMGSVNLQPYIHDMQFSAFRFFSRHAVQEGSIVFSNLMHAEIAAGNIKLATFYGKQAVFGFQQMRREGLTLDKTSQRRFLISVESAYRTLARILFQQGRLEEFCQIVDLLRQEEYLNFENLPAGVPNLADLLLAEFPDLTPRESSWGHKTKEYVDGLIKARMEPGNESSSAFKSALNEAVSQSDKMVTDFAMPKEPSQDEIPYLLDSTARLKKAINGVGPGTAVLYMLANDDCLLSAVVFSDRIHPYEASPLPIGQLQAQVQLLRQSLGNRSGAEDPRVPAKQLYDLIFPNLKELLAKEDIHRVLVATDGPLRAIPLSALSPDGKTFLVQSFEFVRFTPAAIERLLKSPHSNPSVLAAAMTKGDPPLPAAGVLAKELSNEIFTGTYLLNSEAGHAFNHKSLLASLDKHPNIVHFDTHFVLGHGVNDSFLLFGDKSQWTLAEIQAEKSNLFDNTDLVTFAACRSADLIPGSRESGEPDIDNIGLLAQRKGAVSVLASLWEAGDASSLRFMNEFYMTKKLHPEMPCSQIIRQIQLEFLLGPGSKPDAIPDMARPFAHPVNWACWELFGNAK